MSRYISPVLYILLMLVGCVAFISIAGVRIGIFEPLTGFSMLRKSVIASLVLSLLAVCSLGICRKERNAASQRFFMLVLTVSLVYSAMWIAFYIQKAELPKMNDITTDTSTPPSYMNVSFMRKSNENGVGYNREFISIQQKYYSDIKPFYTTEKKTDVYAAVTKLVDARNWEVVADYTQVGVIEATARTPIFGFRDDVIIRVTKLENGNVRVDMRSSSRVGKGDYGLNAERVSSFMKDLSKTLAEAPTPAINTTR